MTAIVIAIVIVLVGVIAIVNLPVSQYPDIPLRWSRYPVISSAPMPRPWNKP